MKIKFGDNSLNLKVDGSLANIDRGPRGYSAYEIAVQEGFVGTEEEWLASLAGPEGKQGKDGERGIQGPRGQQGDKGDKGDKGDTGNDGHTPVKGVDYFTSEDIASLNIPYSLSDLSDDSAHRTVTDVEKSTWNNKYDKPSSGIPATDLSGQVQASLGKADTALQEHQDLTDYVKNTDYASSSKGGVVKPSSTYATNVNNNGVLYGLQRTYEQYTNDANSMFIAKGTLENVIAGKELVDQTTLDESQEVQDAKIDWLQTLVNQMPTVRGQGTYLSLESVLNYRLMKFLPQGGSSQESTTGKNLLNSITDTATRNGITFTKNSDGTYTLNGTSTSDIDFNIASDVPLDLNTSYILSGSPNTASNTTYRIMGACTRENDSTTYIADNDGSGVTIPSSKKIRVYINVKNGKTLNNVIFKPMIRLESITDDTYEPYTGGIPAPNPSYPFPVKTVTGENSLIISNKNLFDESQLIKNYYINASGQIVASNGFAYSNLIPVKQATYMLSGRNTENITSNKRVHGYDENGDWVKQITYVAVTGISDYSTSILIDDASIKYIRLSIYGSDADVQLELGSSITSYIEHQSQTYPLSLGNIELNSSPDGTIRDYIYGTPDNWYKREYIGKVVLDGSETYTSMAWGSSGKYGYRTSINDLKIITSANEKSNIRSDYFTVASANGLFALTVPNYGICARVNQSEIIIRNDDTTTVNDFKTWLSTHNTIVWYQKSEYTDIPITDTTLINQLNDIYNNAHSYNGTTNITTTYESGNEQMYLDIEALAKDGSITTETDPVFSASASSGITSSDITNWNNKADVEDIPDLTDYVKDTNYAGSTKGGVIRINGNLGLSIDTSNGNLKTSVKTYAQYDSMTNSGFVGKGTLENVITGKNLADKNYVDTAIATAITNTLGGSY